MYLAGKSLPEIQGELGIGYTALRGGLLRAGIQLRSKSDAIKIAGHKISRALKGKTRVLSDAHRNNISTARRGKGRGYSIKQNGYIEFTMGENKHRGQHVLVMETHIGRRIAPDEVVHHIDENKQNNALENLRLMKRADHASHHINKRNYAKR